MLYTDIFILKEMIESEGIPFEFERVYDGYQLGYPALADYICKVSEHRFSVGGSYDTLELEGLTRQDEEGLEGYLTALDVYGRIKTHWDENKDIMKEMNIV